MSAALSYPSGVVIYPFTDSVGNAFLIVITYVVLILNPLFLLGTTTTYIYIADSNNHRIRKVTISTGIITTYAGTGTAGYSGDNGQPTSATLSSPLGVAVDSSGNLFS